MIKSTLFAAAAATMMLAMPVSSANAGPMMSPGALDANVAVGSGSLVEKVGRRHRRRLGIGAGIVTLGILGAIAADRAHSRPYYRDRRNWRCNRWRRACYRGNNRACWRFDTRC